jgi:hypothetical protein
MCFVAPERRRARDTSLPDWCEIQDSDSAVIPETFFRSKFPGGVLPADLRAAVAGYVRRGGGGRYSPEGFCCCLSTSPFRKLRIAESEHGLQNFTESGYGFRIYGIEMDMYGISRGIIFFWKSQIRHLRIPRIHGFRADSAKNGAPISHA